MTVTKPLRWAALAMLLCVGVYFLPSSVAAEAQTTTKEGMVTTVDPVGHKITVDIGQPITVLGDTAGTKLTTLAEGDAVRLDVTDKNEAQAASIQKVNPFVDVSTWHRLLAGFIAFAIVMLAASYCAKWDPIAYFRGADNRISNSQTQLVLWSATVFVVYLTTLFLRVVYGWDHLPETLGGVEIPVNLLAVSGLSALSFAGARAVTVSKDASAKAANVDKAPSAADRVLEKTPVSAGAGSFRDLFRNDGNAVDLGDTQMILITFTAVLIYVLQSFVFLGHIELSPHVTLPDVDTTLLATFGIGQGAYLAKKAASDPGKG